MPADLETSSASSGGSSISTRANEQVRDDALDYVMRSVASFLRDNPDSEFQRGFLAALVVVAREGFNHSDGDIDMADLLTRDPGRRIP